MSNNNENFTISNAGVAPKTFGVGTALNGIIIRKNKETGERELLFGKRAAHKSGGGQLGLVGGTQEANETMKEGLARELEEEIGIRIDPKRLTWNNCAELLPAPGVTFVHHAFVLELTDADDEPKNMEPAKCDGLYWIAESKLREDLNNKEELAKYFASFLNVINFLNGTPYDDNNIIDNRRDSVKAQQNTNGPCNDTEEPSA